MGKIILANTRRENHNAITIQSSAEEMPQPNSVRLSYDDLTITSVVEEMPLSNSRRPATTRAKQPMEALPVTGRGGPEGCETLRFHIF
jgi:hypothetical protein